MTIYMIRCGKLYLKFDSNDGEGYCNFRLIKEERYANTLYRHEQAEHIRELVGGTIVRKVVGGE